MNNKLLSVENLRTVFKNKNNSYAVVDDLNFSVESGKTLGIVGESGSGKTISALSVMNLLPNKASIEHGKILFEGNDLTKINYRDMCKIRGNEISMIFQDPIMSLDQVFTVGSQIMEAILTHKRISKAEAKQQALKLLKNVEIADPERVFSSYPFELSGGMCQRVMIAIAISLNPKLIFADEPTTALDVTVQAQIMELLKNLQKRHNMSMVLITHDLGIVSDVADDIIVMYAGKVMEQSKTDIIFNKPCHPYTLGLIKSTPKIGHKNVRLYSIDGMVPDINDMPNGCKFSNRCIFALPKCFENEPKLEEISDKHLVRCHRALEIKEGGLSIE